MNKLLGILLVMGSMAGFGQIKNTPPQPDSLRLKLHIDSNLSARSSAHA